MPETKKVHNGDYRVGLKPDLPEPLAQLRLPELARRRARNLLEEFEALRQLPFRELLREMGTQLIRGRRLSGSKHHASKRPLAPALVRYCDHRGLRNGRVTHEIVLHVDRADPLAAGFDQVLGAVDDAD